jgi:hypothetical protein
MTTSEEREAARRAYDRHCASLGHSAVAGWLLWEQAWLTALASRTAAREEPVAWQYRAQGASAWSATIFTKPPHDATMEVRPLYSAPPAAGVREATIEECAQACEGVRGMPSNPSLVRAMCADAIRALAQDADK